MKTKITACQGTYLLSPKQRQFSKKNPKKFIKQKNQKNQKKSENPKKPSPLIQVISYPLYDVMVHYCLLPPEIYYLMFN